LLPAVPASSATVWFQLIIAAAVNSCCMLNVALDAGISFALVVHMLILCPTCCQELWTFRRKDVSSLAHTFAH